MAINRVLTLISEVVDRREGSSIPVAQDDADATSSTSTTLIFGSSLPPHEAERLLRLATGGSRAKLLGGIAVDSDCSVRFRRLVRRRLAGEPLQYLEGTVQFGPLELIVDRRVLIPRPETEQLWELAMDRLPRRPCTVVDLGTGSGCLALAVKHRRPDVRVIATDICSAALAVARGNADRLDLEVEFRAGDRLDALDPSLVGAVQMVVTNPPYVSESEWDGLPMDVRDYEPRVALVMGDGLDMFRYLATEAAIWLSRGGLLVSEIGDRQGMEVGRVLSAAGWATEVCTDLTGRDRFLVARLNP